LIATAVAVAGTAPTPANDTSITPCGGSAPIDATGPTALAGRVSNARYGASGT